MGVMLKLRDLIDEAMGGPNENTVHFKLLHAVLHILAQQLRVKDRIVDIRLNDPTKANNSIQVNETKVRASALYVPAAGEKTVKWKPSTETVILVERGSGTSIKGSPETAKVDQVPGAGKRLSVITKEEYEALEKRMSDNINGLRLEMDEKDARLNAVEEYLNQVAAKTGLPPSPSIKSEARQPSAASEQQKTTETQKSPEPQMTTETQKSPEPQIAIETQKSPEPQVSTETQKSPDLQATAETQKSPEPQIAIETQKSPEPQTTTETQKWPEPQTTTETQKSPEPYVPPVPPRPPEPIYEPPPPKPVEEKPAGPTIDISKFLEAERANAEKQKETMEAATKGLQLAQDCMEEVEEVRQLATDAKNKAIGAHDILAGYEDILGNMTGSLNDMQSIINSNQNTMTVRQNFLDDRMEKLENTIKDTEMKFDDMALLLSGLDSGFSSQITAIQDQMMDVQHSMESCMEMLLDAGQSGGADVAMVAELKEKLSGLTADVDGLSADLAELAAIQRENTEGIEGLMQQIEVLRDCKADREEVYDCLRDKADISSFNQLVSINYFEAEIKKIYDKLDDTADIFARQELVWEKTFDDMLKMIGLKAPLLLVEDLKAYLENCLQQLHKEIDLILQVIGEPRAAAVARKLIRDSYCLCCADPSIIEAHEKHPGVQRLPCLPVEHDPLKELRGFVVQDTQIQGDIHVKSLNRYCGGSHTIVHPSTRLAAPPRPQFREAHAKMPNVTLGNDGKIYKVDDDPGNPASCFPCKDDPPRTKKKRAQTPESGVDGCLCDEEEIANQGLDDPNK